MKIEDLLNNRTTAMLQWSEPWPALSVDGNGLDAYVTLTATVHDCINLARKAQADRTDRKLSDTELLLDFMATHWAREELR